MVNGTYAARSQGASVVDGGDGKWGRASCDRQRKGGMASQCSKLGAFDIRGPAVLTYSDSEAPRESWQSTNFLRTCQRYRVLVEHARSCLDVEVQRGSHCCWHSIIITPYSMRGQRLHAVYRVSSAAEYALGLYCTRISILLCYSRAARQPPFTSKHYRVLVRQKEKKIEDTPDMYLTDKLV